MSTHIMTPSQYGAKTTSNISYDGKQLFIYVESNNCKLKMGESPTDNLLNVPKDLTMPSQTLFFHVTNEKIKEAITECPAFAVLYCIKVPIGYGSGYQWHICVTTNTLETSYRKRLESEGIVISSDYKNNFKQENIVKEAKAEKSYEQGLYEGAKNAYELVNTAFARKYKLRARLREEISNTVEPLIQKFSKMIKR